MSNCKKKNCGCLDTGLTTPSPCPHDIYQCPDPDPCPETFSDECIVHTGDSLPELGINQGDRLSAILQLLSVWILNPTCADPASTCRSVLNFHSITITPNTIKIGWTNAGAPTSLQVEYKLASGLSWFLNPALAPISNADTIGGLLADTWYDIRLNAICPVGNCYSAIILVKTNP
jgi:hypothetical protein